MDELKPCPFCGEPAVTNQSYDDEYPITCGNENCIMWPHYYSVNQWNYRPAEDALRAEVAKLREALENIDGIGFDGDGYRETKSLLSLIEELREIACKALGKKMQSSQFDCMVDPNRWIPLAERLPDKSGDYLVTDGDGWYRILPFQVGKLEGTYSRRVKPNSFWYTDSEGDPETREDFTHWRPLPEPPEVEA